MKRIISTLWFALLGIACTVAGQNNYPHPGYDLHFKNFTIRPVEYSGDFHELIPTEENETFDGKFFVVLQFFSIPDDLQRQQMRDHGVELLDYLPHFGYIAMIPVTIRHEIFREWGVRAFLSLNEGIKLSPDLYSGTIPEHAFREGGTAELIVMYFQSLNPDMVIQHLHSRQFHIVHRDDFSSLVHIITHPDRIAELARLPYVVYVEPVNPPPVHDNYTGRALHRCNNVATDYFGGRRYDGTGVNVALQDDGVIGPHIDYEGRIMAQYVSINNGNHGDHCAGIIMGAGNANPTGKGMASGANLYVYSASNYQAFINLPNHYFTNQIRITSTSYSDGCNTGYTSLARTMDQQSRLYRKVLHVFSAGNSGTDNCGYGAGPGWGNITGGHKAAKNVIAVANVSNTDALNSSSSRGPAHDGRIKPELSAKGTNVFSTIDPHTYDVKTGTSMSCPAVAGLAAQLYHAYRELNAGMDPPGGLIKALMMNTADDLGNPGPDFRFGFGRVNGLRAVRSLELGHYDTAVISNGQINQHIISIPDNVAEFRIMVYWTDFEASINTNWALVNNIDIKITDPSGTDWMPWVLSHFPHPDSLNKPAVRGYDNRNNQEQITIPSPQPGDYLLTVSGTNIPQGPQSYYIVYSFVPIDVTLTYPYGGEKWVPGNDEIIRWDAYGNEGLFTLEFSLDNGNTWTTIKNDIPGNLRYYNWSVPNAITGKAWLRISRGSSMSMTNAPITIAPVPTGLKIDWACSNALHLSWNEVFGATQYVIYRLGNKYMEPIGTTNVNSFIVYNIQQAQTYWFSVSVKTPDGAVGQRANAIQKIPGTQNCFPTDALMLDSPSVNWGLFQACMPLTSLPVTVRIKNFGLEPIINPELRYQLNNGEIFSEVYQGTILPDSVLTYTFSSNINISQIGTYSLKTWVVYPPDQNPANNEKVTNFEVIQGQSITPGIMQDMQSFTQCLPVPLCELYTCTLGNGWINLANQVLDQIDWRTWKGSTYTFNTGPSFDHTTGTTAGHYLYLEASTNCFNREAILSMPCVDLTNGVSPSFSLWYHAYGADMGRLHVDLFDGTQIIRDVVPPVVGNQGDEWKQLTFDLSPWNGKVIAIRIRGITGSGERSDLAIDDIYIDDVTLVRSDPQISPSFSISPNPGKGYFTLTCQDLPQGKYNLKLMDLTGHICHQQSLQISNNTSISTLNLSHLSPGIYLIQLASGTFILHSKLIVH